MWQSKREISWECNDIIWVSERITNKRKILRRSEEGENDRCLPWSKEEDGGGAYIFWMKQVPVQWMLPFPFYNTCLFCKFGSKCARVLVVFCYVFCSWHFTFKMSNNNEKKQNKNKTKQKTKKTPYNCIFQLTVSLEIKYKMFYVKIIVHKIKELMPLL